jgi:hypothetical protein
MGDRDFFRGGLIILFCIGLKVLQRVANAGHSRKNNLGFLLDCFHSDGFSSDLRFPRFSPWIAFKQGVNITFLLFFLIERCFFILNVEI